MNKQYFYNALECENQSNEIPLWELEFHLWNKYSNKQVILGEAFSLLTEKEKEIALNTNAEVMAEVCENFGFSALTTPGGYWEIAPGNPAYYWLPEPYRMNFTKILQKMIGDNVALVHNSAGTLGIPDSEHYVSFAMEMFQNPDKVIQQAEKILANSIEHMKKYLDIGIDIFFTAADIADNSGPFFAPDHFHAYILPYLTRWSQFITDNGGFSIMHTDGNINIYIEEIANSPVNGLQAIDPLAGMDIVLLKKQVGNRLCLCGNIDVGLMITGTPESIYEETSSLLKNLKDSPGFSLGCSNVLEEAAPKENFEALVKAYKDFLKR